MAKITALPNAAPVSGSEKLPIVQDGQMRNVDLLALLAAPGAPDAIMLGDRTLRQVLATIQYPGMKITSLTIAPAQAEIGDSVTVNLTAVLSKNPTAQTLNGAALANPAATRTAAVPNVTVTTNFTWAVTDAQAPDAPASDNKTVSITFLNKGHAGFIDKAAGAALTAAEVNGVAASWFASGVARTLNLVAAADGYLWYSQPASQADPTGFKIGGLSISPTKTTRAHVTGTGQAVSYKDFLLSDRVPAGTSLILEVIA